MIYFYDLPYCNFTLYAFYPLSDLTTQMLSRIKHKKLQGIQNAVAHVIVYKCELVVFIRNLNNEQLFWLYVNYCIDNKVATFAFKVW